jgi:hypothetical protein
MAWSYLAMIVSGVALVALHLWRRSRHTWLAVVALVLAIFTFLSGFTIGVFTILVLNAAALAVPSARRVA